MNPQLAFPTSNSSLMGSLSPYELKQTDAPTSNESIYNTPQKMLAHLENQLNKNLPGNRPNTELNTADFSPSAVSDRIIGFVENAISQGAQSDLDAQNMLQQAKEGISRGFAEAREILDAMSQMTDSIKSDINKTEELIFKGLDELQNAPVETPRQQQIGELISQSASLSTQFKQTSQASIQIITQDGDKVEVSYSALIEAASHSNVSQNQQMTSVNAEFSSTTSSSFQFSVQGDLDSGEQQAINELLNNVGDLASQFFDGDVQAAFKSAMELGFNSDELKGFALNFQQSTYTAVTQTYQRTEQLNSPTAADSLHDKRHHHSHGSNRGPSAAINMLSQLNDLMEQSRENVPIQQPDKTIKSLLTDMLNLLNDGLDTGTQRYITSSIEQM